MTKKDYVIIAAAFASTRKQLSNFSYLVDLHPVEMAEESVALALMRDNPRFRVGPFFDACRDVE